MKQLLLLFSFAIGFVVVGYGQDEPPCEPDPNAPPTEPIFPIPYVGDGLSSDTSGINLPACIGEPYSFVLTIQSPDTFNQNGNLLPLQQIALATEGAIKVVPPGGLPSTSPPLANGLDYRCNPPNCVFLTDSAGCLVIEGTPDFDGPDTLNLGISVTLTIQPNIPINFSFPNSEFPGNYFLEIKESGACDDITSTRDLSQDVDFSIIPNPANDFAQLNVNSSLTGRFQLRIFNVLGQSMSEEAIHLFQGENQIPLNMNGLSKGIYLINLSQGNRSITRRLVKN